MREYPSNRAHEKVATGGGTAPHGRPQVTQEDHVGRAGECGTTWAGVEGGGMDGLRGKGSGVWYHGRLEYRRSRPLGLQAYSSVDEERGKVAPKGDYRQMKRGGRGLHG